jgi:hypothetical protein
MATELIRLYQSECDALIKSIEEDIRTYQKLVDWRIATVLQSIPNFRQIYPSMLEEVETSVSNFDLKAEELLNHSKLFVSDFPKFNDPLGFSDSDTQRILLVMRKMKNSLVALKSSHSGFLNVIAIKLQELLDIADNKCGRKLSSPRSSVLKENKQAYESFLRDQEEFERKYLKENRTVTEEDRVEETKLMEERELEVLRCHDQVLSKVKSDIEKDDHKPSE